MKMKLPLVIGFFLLAGCGATKESTGGGSVKDYEATFRPSDFDQPLGDLFPESHRATARDSIAAAVLPTQAPELTQGYRVQIFATSSHDEALDIKAAAEQQFTDEWFYVVYDAPTYKVRAGNFIERYEADRFAKTLAEKGYKDSWVVPERVFSSPPPRPAEPPDEGNPPR